MTDSEPSRHLSEKEISENTLIDFSPGTDRPPKLKGVNGGFAGPDSFNPAQPQTPGKEIKIPALKTDVSGKAGVTSVDPVLGVEQVNRDVCCSDMRT